MISSMMFEITPMVGTELVDLLDQVYATPAPLLKHAIDMIAETQKPAR